MLSVMEVILALKSAPLFQDVPGEGLKRLSDFIQVKNVRAGEVIFAEQDLGDEMYLVRSGRVTVQQDIAGQRTTIDEVTAGGHFGEMAIIDDRPRSSTAIAEENTSLLTLIANKRHRV